MLDEQFFIRHLILQDRTTGDRSLSTRAVLPAAAKVRYHALDAVMYLTFDACEEPRKSMQEKRDVQHTLST